MAIKIVIVGASGSGKTALFKRIVYNEFSKNLFQL